MLQRQAAEVPAAAGLAALPVRYKASMQLFDRSYRQVNALY